MPRLRPPKYSKSTIPPDHPLLPFIRALARADAQQVFQQALMRKRQVRTTRQLPPRPKGDD